MATAGRRIADGARGAVREDVRDAENGVQEMHDRERGAKHIAALAKEAGWKTPRAPRRRPDERDSDALARDAGTAPYRSRLRPRRAGNLRRRPHRMRIARRADRLRLRDVTEFRRPHLERAPAAPPRRRAQGAARHRSRRRLRSARRKVLATIPELHRLHHRPEPHRRHRAHPRPRRAWAEAAC